MATAGLRARLRLAAAAAVVAAGLCAPAHAQIGPCPAIEPAPCIVLDLSKIAQFAQQTTQEASQLEQLKQQATQYTSLQGVLGATGIKGLESGLTTMPSINIGSSMTGAQAANSIMSELPNMSGSQTSIASQRSAMQLELRNAAADGWSVAEVAKQRLVDMNADGQKIQALAAKGVDERSDWQVNSNARILMIRALQNLSEVQNAVVRLHAVGSMQASNSAGTVSMQEPGAVQVATAPTYAAQLGQISDLSNQLAALLNAKEIGTTYTEAMSGESQTIAEYNATVAAAAAAQANVVNLANYDANRKGVSATSLINAANSYMARDTTTWDDPSKSSTATSLADQAENHLDKMVSGDVSNSWSNVLEDRAEAYKQQAYFQPIAADATTYLADDKAYLASYSQSVGVDASNQAALDAAIAQVKSQIATVGNSLSSAPADVQAQRDAIYASTMQSVPADQQYQAQVPYTDPAFLTSSAGTATAAATTTTPAATTPVITNPNAPKTALQ